MIPITIKQLTGKFGTLVLSCCFICFLQQSFAQTDTSFFELRVKNDNAGELSNQLKTGDDLGETQALFLALHYYNPKQQINYAVKLESTEFSALLHRTPEPRDILFTELNTLQLTIDNRHTKNNSAFYAVTVGLNYIQNHWVTFGATGQKYYVHHLLLNTVYTKRYWIYVPAKREDVFIPFVNFNYGFTHTLLHNRYFKVHTITNLALQLSGKSAYAGVGANTKWEMNCRYPKIKWGSIDFLFEGYYLSNLIEYQTCWLQLNAKLNMKRLSFYTGINKPIEKNLHNPYTKYDDLDWLFNFGLCYTPKCF